MSERPRHPTPHAAPDQDAGTVTKELQRRISHVNHGRIFLVVNVDEGQVTAAHFRVDRLTWEDLKRILSEPPVHAPRAAHRGSR